MLIGAGLMLGCDLILIGSVLRRSGKPQRIDVHHHHHFYGGGGGPGERHPGKNESRDSAPARQSGTVVAFPRRAA
jgi:hypothetical protein